MKVIEHKNLNYSLGNTSFGVSNLMWIGIVCGVVEVAYLAYDKLTNLSFDVSNHIAVIVYLGFGLLGLGVVLMFFALLLSLIGYLLSAIARWFGREIITEVDHLDKEIRLVRTKYGAKIRTEYTSYRLNAQIKDQTHKFYTIYSSTGGDVMVLSLGTRNWEKGDSVRVRYIPYLFICYRIGDKVNN